MNENPLNTAAVLRMEELIRRIHAGEVSVHEIEAGGNIDHPSEYRSVLNIQYSHPEIKAENTLQAY